MISIEATEFLPTNVGQIGPNPIDSMFGDDAIKKIITYRISLSTKPKTRATWFKRLDTKERGVIWIFEY